ncbi:MAG: hypothetical protein H7039_12940 [Bryobacteraceae bacterium]|nr:hypothetical protein [Bryobacteraceae bacterium]
MALFTDGNIANLNDLRAYESSILDLASTEGIDLGAKLALAQREMSFEILAFLLRRGQLSTSRRELNEVVVTEPMLHAHVISTLALIYRDAFNSQLNDRYQGKWIQYAELARRAVKQLLDIGVGLTSTPLQKPQPPQLDAVTGYGFATTYSVKIAAVGTSGFSSVASDTNLLDSQAGTNLSVTLPRLPSHAMGFVIYAGSTESAMARQTEQPLPENTIWSLPLEGLRSDLADLVVQSADSYVLNRQEMLRG